MLIYNDLFVAPKLKELDKLKKKEEDQHQVQTKKSSSDEDNRTKEVQSPKKKRDSPEQIIQIEDGGESLILELKVEKSPVKIFGMEEELDIIEQIMNKYNTAIQQKKDSKNVKKQVQSIFSKQLEVQPPEASYFSKLVTPMMPAQGWTPAIPPGIKNISKHVMQDILIRAKSGLSTGDA